MKDNSDDMCFHECPKCNCRCNCSTQPCSCCDEEVTCNMCGNIMWYSEEDGVYICTNSECTRYVET